MTPIRESARETAKETGGEVTQSLARVAELADVILTVVTDDAAMYAIFATERRLAAEQCAKARSS